MTLPVSLAFYLDHASEVDQLVAMQKPSDVSPEDWSMFQDVYGWACGHVEELLGKARAGAREALSSRAATSDGSKGIGQGWFLNTLLTAKSPIAFEGKLYAGVSFGLDAKSGVRGLAPYLALGKNQRAQLLERLLGAGFSECAAATERDTIYLRDIPIGKDTDLDAAIAESTACFRLLAERWEQVFGAG